jgi:hypothetical protein
MAFNFEIIRKFPNIGIFHHVDATAKVWGTHHRKVFFLKDGNRTNIGVFPISLPRDLFSFSRPTARAMRSDKSNLFVNKFGKILGIRGGNVYSFSQNQPEKLFEINGDSVLHGGICEDAKGNIYFGEYFMNPDRVPVNIWCVAHDLSSWHIAHKVEGIRHVHGIFPDPFDTGVFWITAGDFEDENLIFRTDETFKKLTTFGDGGQPWRTVHLFFTKAHINWLTDSNLEQNHACRMDRISGELEMGQPIDASTWYGCTTVEGLHIAFTTIERGPAIQTDKSKIMVSRDAFHWEPVASFKKDFWKPVQIFKYGVISCPSGKMSLEDLYLSGEGLVGLDGTSIAARITES